MFVCLFALFYIIDFFVICLFTLLKKKFVIYNLSYYAYFFPTYATF